MCGGTIFIGGLIACGQVGELSAHARFSFAIFSVFAAFFGFYHTARQQKTIQLDISGTGQIRLAERDSASASCQEKNWPHVKQNGGEVRLLQDSTIWPHMLLLRLQAEDGKIAVVPVLPDSVSRDSFRALSVACRWIAAQNNSALHKNSVNVPGQN